MTVGIFQKYTTFLWTRNLYINNDNQSCSMSVDAHTHYYEISTSRGICIYILQYQKQFTMDTTFLQKRCTSPSTNSIKEVKRIQSTEPNQWPGLIFFFIHHNIPNGSGIDTSCQLSNASARHLWQTKLIHKILMCTTSTILQIMTDMQDSLTNN